MIATGSQPVEEKFTSFYFAREEYVNFATN